MHLLKSLVTLSLITVLTRAVPIASDSRVELSEREFDELISRGPGSGKKAGAPNTLYAPHGKYDKDAAVKFTKSIPLSKLEGGGVRGKQGTIHSDGANGHRLDYQGKTSDGKHNLQVQINGQSKTKSTVGGVITTGNLSPGRLRKELVHSVMHPPKDKQGNEYMHHAK